MRDVVERLDAWHADGRRSAVATVVATKRSAPRGPGAKMAIAEDGAVEGAVSGGCVEGAVVAVADEVLRGAAPRLLEFTISDEQAWDVGLPCGGEIAVWVDRAEGLPVERFAALARSGGRGALVTRLDDGARLLVDAGGDRTGTLGRPELDAAAAGHAAELMWSARSEQRHIEGIPVFVDAVVPPGRLIIVGAVELAGALASVARGQGWRALVADPRPRFAAPGRFPDAEQVVAAWPADAIARVGGIDAATAVAVLTHDPKVDDEALALALRSPAFFVGAIGARRTQAARRERLLARGLTEAELDRLSGPIGLDLGATTPAETALSIMAEIVAVAHGRSGGRLRDAAGRIHEEPR
jgi:xanthine dehydrogenase accessory factor